MHTTHPPLSLCPVRPAGRPRQVDPLAPDTQAGAWLGRLREMERRVTRVVKQLEATLEVGGVHVFIPICVCVCVSNTNGGGGVRTWGRAGLGPSCSIVRSTPS